MENLKLVLSEEQTKKYFEWCNKIVVAHIDEACVPPPTGFTEVVAHCRLW